MTSESGYNDSAYSNPAYDALMAEAKTAADPMPLYTQAEQILAQDFPLLPIYHYSSVYMLNDAIKNWPVNNVQQNWYSKDIWRVAEE